GLTVTRVASAPWPMSSRAASLSLMGLWTLPDCYSFPRACAATRRWPGRSRDRAIARKLILFRFLASLAGVGGLSCCFGFGLLLARLALRVRLVLLRLALSQKVLVAGDRAGHLLDLALGSLDQALNGFLGTTLVRHQSSSVFADSRLR